MDDDTLGTLPTSEKYIPAVMQALFYYVEMLQYEQCHTTTLEPPGNIGSNNANYTTESSPTTSKTTRTTTSRTTRTTTPRTTRSTTRTTRKPTTVSTTQKPESVESTTPTIWYSTILDLWCKKTRKTDAIQKKIYNKFCFLF